MVAVRDRELPVQRVVERQVFGLPVPHGNAADGLRGERVDGGADETVHPPVVIGVVAGGPLLAGPRVQLAVRGHPERVLDLPVAIRVGRGRQPVSPEPEPVRPRAPQHAQVVVVGVVLHHEHHDVLDLRDGVGARSQLRVRQRPWLAQRCRTRCRAPRSGTDECPGRDARLRRAPPADSPGRLPALVLALPFVHVNSSPELAVPWCTSLLAPRNSPVSERRPLGNATVDSVVARQTTGPKRLPA